MAQPQIVRYGELRPCRTAFIDTHTPGSDQKENFTIIGGGVSESSEQFVHIPMTPGFNIGAAGQPPGCTNSLHTHTTAEVFFVLHGRWRFFWGRDGGDGEVVLTEGDLFNIPTDCFRGFENVGTDYGMLMAVLGGDDPGGVVWAPQVLAAASEHGLILGDNGVLYDSSKGEQLPEGVAQVTPLTEQELAGYPKVDASTIVADFVARYLDMRAIAKGSVCRVIGEAGMLYDRPGFEIDFLTEQSATDARYINKHQVYIVQNGYWRLHWDSGSTVLASGDTCLIAPESKHDIKPAVSGTASLFRVTATDDPAGLTKTKGA